MPKSRQMTIVCIINLEPSSSSATIKNRAFTDIEKACQRIKASLTVVPFKNLDFGETSALESFYNADVVIVDISTGIVQALGYHVGVRHSMGMKHNIIISCEIDTEVTHSFKIAIGDLTFYAKTSPQETCYICNRISTRDPPISVKRSH